MEQIMKNLLIAIVLVAALNLGACMSPPTVTAQQTSVSFQLFYNELSPYGSWVDYQDYGYVWIPDVDRDFTPYGTDGRWIYTNDGWTWYSNYSWGWAPFHYGRWAYDDSYGWLWVPQNEWGPAWVTWRRSEGYYGWAPMGPGISIELSFGGGYRVPDDRWTFVRDRDIMRDDVDRYYVDRSTNVTIINTSTVINNTYIDRSRNTTYIAGPARDDVQRVVGTTIQPRVIQDHATPGQAVTENQLQIFRPKVAPRRADDRSVAPTKVESIKEVKPVSERPRGQGRRQEAPPPAVAPPAVAPAVVPPPADMKRDNREPVRPPDANPAERQGREQKPPVVQPPADMKKDNREPVRPPDANPAERQGRQQRPPVVQPPEKQNDIQTPPRPPDATPADRRGREHNPPPVVQPPEKRNDIQTPPRPPDANPADRQRHENAPPAVAPLETKKDVRVSPPPVDRRGRLQPVPPSEPTGKKKPPEVTAPPAKKGRDAQPPRVKRPRPDSLNVKQ
jgi:hypothetical protein